MFIKGCIIYDTTYGCIKQYKYENVLWILSVLSFTWRVIRYRFINAPGNGIKEKNGINGLDISYFRQTFAC